MQQYSVFKFEDIKKFKKMTIQKIEGFKNKRTFRVVSSVKTFSNDGRFIGTPEEHFFGNFPRELRLTAKFCSVSIYCLKKSKSNQAR